MRRFFINSNTIEPSPPCVAHRPPSCRRKQNSEHPTRQKGKPPVSGDLRTVSQMLRTDWFVAIFKAFRWVENLAGERVGVVNVPRLSSQWTATPTTQGFPAFLLSTRSGATSEALVPIYEQRVAKSAEIQGKL